MYIIQILYIVEFIMLNTIYWSILMFDKLSLDAQSDVSAKRILFHFLVGDDVVASRFADVLGDQDFFIFR